MNFFESVVSFFETFWNFLKMTIDNIVFAVTFLVTSQNAIMVIMGYMPFVIGGACLAFIAIGVIRFLLLR